MIVTVTTDTCVSKLVGPALPDSIPVVPATTNCSSDIPASNASSDAHDPSSGINIYLSSDLHSTSTYDDGNGSTDDEFENIYVKRKKIGCEYPNSVVGCRAEGPYCITIQAQH